MKVLFWGTPDFAVPSLRALDGEGFRVVGVVTQPDRPAGRGRRLKPSAIKQLAGQLSLPVLCPERPRSEEFLDAIRACAPDVSVVAAYGHILTREVLDVPRLGSVNVHASLLPELRGAAPINWAIARGHERTGVTIMRMVEAMDAGPVIRQLAQPILADETAAELSMRLSELGAEALIEALALMSAGQAQEVEQHHEAATYAPKVDRDTARIDWGRTSREVALHVRGMDAVPGAWSSLDGVAVKLFRPAERAAATDRVAAPGTVLEADPALGVAVATGDGALVLTEVQPAGRRKMAATDWIKGRGVAPGQRFE